MKDQNTRSARFAAKEEKQAKTKELLPFSRMNYILLIVGIVVIAFGFLLMSGDKFVDSKEFSVQLHIAPIVVVAGFIEIIYAIMYQDKKAQAIEDSQE